MRDAWRLAIGGGAVALSSGLACSVAFTDSGAAQCQEDRDCVARFPDRPRCVDQVCVPSAGAVSDGGTDGDAAVDPTWSCLGSTRWVTPDLSRTVRITYRFVRLVGSAPITDMPVLPCQRIDPECRGALTAGRTDDGGLATVTVPRGFEGFLKVDPVASFPEMMPTLYFVLPPPEADTDVNRLNGAVGLPSVADINILTAMVGKPAVDPNLGHVFGLALDCLGRPAAGVAYKISRTDPKTISYYVDSVGSPSIEVKETSSIGQGGYVNLPVGPVTLEATVPAIGKRLGSYSLLIKAGTATFVQLPPSP